MKVFLFVLALFVLTSSSSFSQTHKELKAYLDIREQYDNNIFLSPNDEQSDYLTMVEPTLVFSLLSQHRKLDFKYSPTFVSYAKEDETGWRHEGSLNFRQDLSEHLRFDLFDSYLKSDDPIEIYESDIGSRNSRNEYQRNIGRARVHYLFGPENALVLGYNDQRLRNDDKSQNDRTIVRPFATVTYQLSVRHQLDFKYNYTNAHFWRDDHQKAYDDYYGHAPGITYVYRFTPHTKGSLGYTYTTRNFEGAEEDYKIHSSLVGFNHAFSPTDSISAKVGFFTQEREDSSDQTGISYNLAYAKTIERGNIIINGSGGWDERTLTAKSRGFSKYWAINSKIEYQILKMLKGYVNGFYREDSGEANIPGDFPDRGVTDVDWEIVRASCGLTWDFHRSLSLVLDYTYTNRTDDIEVDSYRDQRVSLALRYNWYHRW